MLTLFTVSKPFRDHIGVIQRNAIRSWLELRPECQVILCGPEHEVRPVALELGAEWTCEMQCNRFGTPLVNSVFAAARRLARHRLLAYVNADIILLDDFVRAIRRIPLYRFLAVGRRWDIDQQEPMDFSKPDWQARLWQEVRQRGTIHPPAGSDFFVFPTGKGFDDLPPFAVGRQGWDNWMIANARKRRAPVVDITPSARIIHQSHDYAHVPLGDGRSYDGPESRENRRLLGKYHQAFTLLDATHLLRPEGLRRTWGAEYFWWRFHRHCGHPKRIIPRTGLLTAVRGEGRGVRSEGRGVRSEG